MKKELQPTTQPRNTARIEKVHDDVFSTIDRIRERNKTFLGSLSLTATERRMLEVVDEKNLTAISSAMDGQNAAIRALAEGQARMVEQVTSILLKKTLSTIHADVADHVSAEALRLRGSIDANSQAFYRQVTRSLELAKEFPEPIRQRYEADCLAALDDWSLMIGRIRTDFTNLITEA